MAGNYAFSAPINIVRYRNGTLLKLAASTHEFTSYNYDAETRTGTFDPETIQISVMVEGDITIGSWSYSTDGQEWEAVVSGEHGMTLNEDYLELEATSDLYQSTNSNITIMCTSADGGYYDTVTIVRTIDPIIAFQKVYTDLRIDREKIALIASDEQLRQFSESQTMVDKMAAIEVKADSITSEVHASYSTKSYVDAQDEAAKSAAALDATGKANAAIQTAAADATQKANAAQSAAQDYTDDKLDDYSTTVEMNSAIDQRANQITASVQSQYATKESVKKTYTLDLLHYLATPQATGVTTQTSGWTTTPQYVTATNKYLWLYHTYSFTDGTGENSTPYIGGVYGDKGLQGEKGDNGAKGDKGDKGDNGVSIGSITEYYALNNSTTAPADSAFSTAIRMPTADNKYVWNYELITYSDSTTSRSEKHIVAMYGVVGERGTGISSITDYYAVNNSTTPPADSSFSPQVAQPTSTSKYLWNYEVITYSDGTSTQTAKRVMGTYGEKGDRGEQGERGYNGVNTAMVILYKRSTYAPVSPLDPLVYSFTDNSLTGNKNGWSMTIPAGSDPCWAIGAVASATSTTDTITNVEWSTPAKIIENGVNGQDGTNGTNGLNQATIQLYRRAATAPSKPTTRTTYTFATGDLNPVPTGWSRTIPTGTDPCYVTSAAAISSDSTYIISAWGNVSKLVEDGTDGEDGVGIVEVIPLYYLSATTGSVAAPTENVTYTGTSPNRWTRNIPAVSSTYQYLYTCDQILNTAGVYSWSTVVQNNALTSLATRMSEAELKITDEAIISTVRKEYGTVEQVDVNMNLLLDSNAPTLDNVDLTDAIRRVDALNEWTALSSNVDDIQYGLVITATGTGEHYIAWYGNRAGAVTVVPESTYTISCYVRTLMPGILRLRYNSYSFATINVPYTGEWKRIYHTFTAPTAAQMYDGNTIDVWFQYRFDDSATEVEEVELGEEGTTGTSTDYQYFAELCGFMLTEGDELEEWNDGVNMPSVKLATTQSVQSQIYQSADEIRLKADKIAWESENSSMTEDGKLTCNEANIHGSITSNNSDSTRYIRVEDGAIYGGAEGTDSFIDFKGLFGDGEGPYIKGNSITFEANDVYCVSGNDVLAGVDMGTTVIQLPYNIRTEGRNIAWDYIEVRLIGGIICNPNT